MPIATIRCEAGGWPEQAQGWGAQPGAGGLLSHFYLLALTLELQGKPAPCHPERGPDSAESLKRDQEEEMGENKRGKQKSHRVRQNEAGGEDVYRE